jgi:rare lipoprotein A (peptidoglycan hydrolase)
VTNLATGASAVCRVADRGPESWTGHIIDLSPDVFGAIASRSTGVISVSLAHA